MFRTGSRSHGQRHRSAVQVHCTCSISCSAQSKTTQVDIEFSVESLRFITGL